jgi:hypothetical protein
MHCIKNSTTNEAMADDFQSAFEKCNSLLLMYPKK